MPGVDSGNLVALADPVKRVLSGKLGVLSYGRVILMPAKKKANAKPLTGTALIKETVRRIRLARSFWDAHRNGPCRGEREKALLLYESLTEAEREQVPQVLRVWLRYRSEKYFGDDRTKPGGSRKG
jgi:hypothetical protein